MMAGDFTELVVNTFFKNTQKERKNISYDNIANKVEKQKAETTDEMSIEDGGAEIIFDED